MQVPTVRREKTKDCEWLIIICEVCMRVLKIRRLRTNYVLRSMKKKKRKGRKREYKEDKIKERKTCFPLLIFVSYQSR
jgi:hypothetical protein